MNRILRNILAVIIGFIAGSLVNMAIINISSSVIPPPAGADVSTTDGLKAAMRLFQPKHFIMPFLAHALGTLAGAWIAALIAASSKIGMALVVGVLFLLGGIAAVVMLPSPTWFAVLDLALAYIPMAYLGGRLGNPKRRNSG